MTQKLSMVLVAILILSGCEEPSKVIEDGTVAHGFTWTSTDVPISQPRFQREYNVKLPGGFTVSCRMETSWNGFREVRGYPHLIEPSGRNVSFNHDAIARDIIRPELIQPTEEAMRLIFALDAEYIGRKPATVTDDTGKIWKVQQ